MVSKENGALFATTAFVMAATKNKQRAFCFGVSPRNVNSSRDDRGVSTRVNFFSFARTHGAVWPSTCSYACVRKLS